MGGKEIQCFAIRSCSLFKLMARLACSPPVCWLICLFPHCWAGSAPSLSHQDSQKGCWRDGVWRPVMRTTLHLCLFSEIAYFIFIFGCPGSSMLLSPVAASWDSSRLAMPCGGFSCCGALALGWSGFRSGGAVGLVALQHVGSSQTRNQTHVPCTGRQILNHRTARRAPSSISWPLGFDHKAKLTNRTGLRFCVGIIAIPPFRPYI